MSIRISLALTGVVLCLMLIGCGRGGPDQLISRLQSADVQTRRTAARECGHDPNLDDRIVAALTHAVTDSDAEVRCLSIESLGKQGPNARSTVPVLAAALKDSESSVRLQAALAIQKIDPTNSSFAPVLIETMRDGDGRVLLAVGAMGKQAGWAVPTLISLLSHPSPNMRTLAAQTLGRIGPTASTALGPLRQATRDANLVVQRAAQRAIDQIEPSATRN
jgi:HEAT repeat protein